MEEFRKVPPLGYGKGSVVTSCMPGSILIVMGWVLVRLGIPVSSSFYFEEIGFLRISCLIIGPTLIMFGFVGLGEGISKYKIQSSWFSTTLKARTDIVQCEEVDNSENYSHQYDVPMTDWYLRLKPIPEQLAAMPDTTLVSVSIRESQYRDYQGKTSVIIFYSPVDPFVFLLEDEL